MADFAPESVAFVSGHFIAGTHVGEGERIPVARPSDRVDYAELPVADAATVDRAVTDAARAVRTSGWATRPPRERARVMRRWADLIEERAEARPVGGARLDPADSPGGDRRRRQRRRRHPLLLRMGRQARRRGRGDARRPSRHDRLRALWRRRRDHTLEFPAQHGELEGRTGARRRQRYRPEALRADAVLDGAAGRARSRPASRPASSTLCKAPAP